MSHHKHHEKHHGSDSDSDDDRKEHHHDKHHDKHHEKHHGGEHRYEDEEEERRRYEGYRHQEGGGGYNGPPGPYGYGGHGNEGQYGHQGYGAGPYGGGPLPPPMTVHSTQVSEAQVKLDGIQAAHSHEATYKRTEYVGAAAAILGAGVAMVSSLSECIHTAAAAAGVDSCICKSSYLLKEYHADVVGFRSAAK